MEDNGDINSMQAKKEEQAEIVYAQMNGRTDKLVHLIKEQPPLTTEDSTNEEEEQQHQRQLLQSIAWLEKQVDILNTKCGALEAQNILVSVQQLDLLARSMAWCASLSTLFLFWRFIFFITCVVHDVFHPWTMSFLSRLAIFLFVKVLLRGALVAFPYYYNEFTHGSAHRRFQVFAIAFIVIARVRLCRWREQMFIKTTTYEDPKRSASANDDDDEEEELENKRTENDVPRYGETITEEIMWEANYEVSARFLYISILRLKGLWTKTAQYLSSRADFMPLSYVRELKRLQDETEPTRWEELKEMIPEPVLETLVEIDETPLASASIGQVHTAILKDTGDKVVVKVQHPHARSLILDDFWSLGVILRLVSWMEPDYEFLEILMREWAKEATKELDFRIEAQNLKDARASIDQLYTTRDAVLYTTAPDPVPFQVEIPKPWDHLCNDQVLVMSFCEGVRVDKFDKLDEWGLSRSALMNGLAQTFAHMMYTTPIFNGDPHPGNLFVRPGTSRSKDEGFTLVLLDWGLAKRLGEQKRLAFCELVYAAATLDYGLLMDSYRNIGIQMKRENAPLSMENVRFFLRDLAPRDVAKRRIKAKVRRDEKYRKTLKKQDRVPMKSKAYPGELFFFIRVNELLHGLGSKFDVDMAYVDALRPYAERGLRQAKLNSDARTVVVPSRLILQNGAGPRTDKSLEKKLAKLFLEFENEGKIAGAQFYAIDKNGTPVADLVAGNLGGLKDHIPMDKYTLVLGFSCTKAVAATIAHVMVTQGYLEYDEPVCKRVWPAFCPTDEPPAGLEVALGLSIEELRLRWQWKRQISLWHILTHQSGMWSAMPAKLSIKIGSNCEKCAAAYEYDESNPEDTLLPEYGPGLKSEYHYMSFGWLVAGTVCGAYAKRHGLESVSFEAVYKAILVPKLSESTKNSGFRPCGGTGRFSLANTVVDDISVTRRLQERRESRPIIGATNNDDGPDEKEEKQDDTSEIRKGYRGKEFLLDPRIWNSMDAIDANSPAAGGRFSAAGLAHFYHDLGTGRILDKEIIGDISTFFLAQTNVGGLQGATSTSNDEARPIHIGCGYHLIAFNRDTEKNYSAFGHAGVGGSIGFHHKPTGLSAALMLNKADGGIDVTKRVLTVFGDHFRL